MVPASPTASREMIRVKKKGKLSFAQLGEAGSDFGSLMPEVLL